ncbi:nitrate reductase molybdenum cofactor assembly chaperone [Skermanella mucosa]|uniref:nitrate reductase molybdenum cofactor assembly chaperone n=1 Tax=Skermanella mucosa TaxID=1789672 RepID=UPI00192BA9DC|nr:nitrate reductase molybdenum cofactor assembly chaperone [Skermanella mucosa]UEM18512.1 nitrate reductase molybdenum cofactor assembly chaperone [Skermanella mucosa]
MASSRHSTFKPLSFKALGALIDYPQAETVEALDAIEAVLANDEILPRGVRLDLAALIETLRRGDLIDLQEEWLALFDRSRALSLHLYQHVHGESRDRGQAMVSLGQLYAAHGLELTASELPDYLPVLCEFLACVPAEVSLPILADAAHILEAIRTRLERKESPYAAVFAGLRALAPAEVDPAKLAGVIEADRIEDAKDLSALDEEWEEKPVTFGPGDAACPKLRHPPVRPAAA